MNRSSILFGIVLAALSSPVFALPKVVYVSASGNDGNPCSRTQPCRTFAGAILAVAPGGEIAVLDSGSYGTLTISQSVTIEAPAGVYAGINATTTDGIDVAVGPSDTVVLRGLTIYGSAGSSDGIYFISSGTLHVESCVINGFPGQGLHASGSGRLYVLDTVFRNMGARGVQLVAFENMVLTASFDHCRFENNAGDGLDVEVPFTVKAAIRDSVASGNANGFLLTNASPGSELNIENCLVVNNVGVGVGFGDSTAGTIRLSGSTVTGNGTGIQGSDVGAQTVFESFRNNHVRGNGTNVMGTITPVGNN